MLDINLLREEKGGNVVRACAAYRVAAATLN
jgi:hypothetical protein